MKNHFTIFLLFFLSFQFVLAQTTIKVESKVKIGVSQKYGPTITDEEYVLEVVYNDTELKFRTQQSQNFTFYELKKATDKYLIGENSGNYCFYAIKDQQLFYMDYFISRYSLGAYGKDYSSLKETALNLMTMLKEGKTQKDIIAHLIKQVEYDF